MDLWPCHSGLFESQGADRGYDQKGYACTICCGEQGNEQGRTQAQPNPAAPEGATRGTINVIEGGGSYAEGSAYSRKGALRRILKDQRIGDIDRGREMSFQVLSLDRAFGRMSFGPEDFENIYMPHDDPLVVELVIANYNVKRCFVDGGSGVDVIFLSTIRAMGLDETQIMTTTLPVSGFADYEIKPSGVITLDVFAAGVTLPVNFVVVDCRSSYNVMMGRPWVHGMHGIPSTLHQVMRCWTPNGVVDIKGCQVSAKKCYNTSLKRKRGREENVENESAASGREGKRPAQGSQ